MEWSVLIFQAIHLETTCTFTCLPSNRYFGECKTHPLQLGLQLAFELVLRTIHTVSLVSCSRLEQTTWLGQVKTIWGITRGEKAWLLPGRTAVGRSCHTAWQTQVQAGIFIQGNADTANTSYVGNEWCNFVSLLFFHTFKPFVQAAQWKKKKKVRNILFSGGVRKYWYSEQERTKSIPEPICTSLKSLHIVIKNRCQNLMSLMSLMAHQQSNQQHKAISEWKSFVTLWKTDTWHLVWQVTRHPCKWRNSVYSLESIKKHFCDPKGSGILKGLFRQSPSKATWHASPLPLHQERGFLIASQLTPLRRP